MLSIQGAWSQVDIYLGCFVNGWTYLGTYLYILLACYIVSIYTLDWNICLSGLQDIVLVQPGVE
jgi:hypothetical protein